jgi:hypothetical protein
VKPHLTADTNLTDRITGFSLEAIRYFRGFADIALKLASAAPNTATISQHRLENQMGSLLVVGGRMAITAATSRYKPNRHLA